MFEEKGYYKPFRFPWADEMEQKQWDQFWLPREIPLTKDITDWRTELTPRQRDFLAGLFRFFVNSDLDVACGYDSILDKIGNEELCSMIDTFKAFERIHVKAYAYLIESLDMPQGFYQEFMQYPEMLSKSSLSKTYRDYDLIRLIAANALGAEGIQLFSSFAVLMHFTRKGLMTGMGQIVSYSLADEQLHCAAMTQVLKEAIKEGGYSTTILPDVVHQFVECEDKFIDLLYSNYEPEGLPAKELKHYIRWLADKRLAPFGEKLYGADDTPIRYIHEFMGASSSDNFINVKSTNYKIPKWTPARVKVDV